MLRKPAFWIAFALVTVASLAFAARYFEKAFPIVTIDLRMDRAGALRSAQELVAGREWGLEGFRQAASFGEQDDQVQTYIELEAGGSEAYIRMQRDGLYQPYIWTVRRFQEKQEREAELRFTSSGDPYGFTLKLPEAEPGAALPAEAARAIAERGAAAWGIDLGRYRGIEASREVRPGGRVDHSFVYELPETRYGEARFRLRLGVGGDRFSGLTHFVHVPEGFQRRYQEMRSDNDTIALLASFAAVLLFILGGCGVGVFFLLRQRWVTWRRPLAWGLFLAGLGFAASLNALPLEWMEYDTALSSRGFLLRQVGFALAGLLGGAAFVTLIFLAAESLSRRAFPHHIQQWRLWSKGVAGSTAVLGRTTAGYLWAGLDVAFVVGFYLLARNWWGWWTPAEVLLQPDLLATYFPWLASLTPSLTAGFVEESMFRAIPLAGAALIGERLGRRRAWILGALVLQALIFASAHANYPGQPAYSRVVELMLPSLAFGAVFLYFGLLPAIISHFIYDLVWFSLPLFVSDAPGVWLDQMLVVLLGLTPLWVVLASRWRFAVAAVPAGAYNRAWQPPVAVVLEAAVPITAATAVHGVKESDDGAALAGAPAAAAPALALSSGRAQRWAVIAGAVGLVVWVGAGEFRADAPRLELRREQALERARNALAEQGVELGPEWKPLLSVAGQPEQEDRFIWQAGGREAYGGLLGTYLAPPRWQVRFARFEGPVEERAEEYQVVLAPDGRVLERQHRLPEARPGESRSEEEARRMARAYLAGPLGADTLHFREVSAEASKRPARQDWTFTFADTVSYPLEDGEGRLEVTIAGGAVVGSRRYVHVPEEWQRRERDRRNLLDLISKSCAVLFGLIVAGALVAAVVRWSRRDYSVAAFAAATGAIATLALVEAFNGWPTRVARFSTAEPFSHQVFAALGGDGLGLLFVATAFGLLAGLAHRWRRAQAPPPLEPLGAGLALAALAVGVSAALGGFLPSLGPHWPGYGAAGDFVPFLATSLDPLMGTIWWTLLLLLGLSALDRFTARWTRRQAPGVILVVAAGLVVAGLGGPESFGAWIVHSGFAGLAGLVLYRVARHTHLAVVPGAVAGAGILEQVQAMVLRPHAGSFSGALVASLLLLALAAFWTQALLGRPGLPARLAALAGQRRATVPAVAE